MWHIVLSDLFNMSPNMCHPYLFARVLGLSVSRLHMPHTEVNICVAVVAGDELPVVGVSVAHYLVHPGNY